MRLFAGSGRVTRNPAAGIDGGADTMPSTQRADVLHAAAVPHKGMKREEIVRGGVTRNPSTIVYCRPITVREGAAQSTDVLHRAAVPDEGVLATWRVRKSRCPAAGIDCASHARIPTKRAEVQHAAPVPDKGMRIHIARHV